MAPKVSGETPSSSVPENGEGRKQPGVQTATEQQPKPTAKSDPMAPYDFDRSLVTGIGGRALTQVGNLVSPSTTLTSVSQVNPIKVYFAISEQEYLALSGRV